MVNYEDLPSKESMKACLHSAWYYYGDMPAFRPKGRDGGMLRDWFYLKGERPHSHNWGRKPYWRKKRREQRRAKYHQLSCSQVTSQLEGKSQIIFAREIENSVPQGRLK